MSFVRHGVSPVRPQFNARRKEQINRTLDGIVGVQLRKLLVPILLFYLRKRRRRTAVDLRAQLTTDEVMTSMIEYCSLHPYLAPLGKSTIRVLLLNATRTVFFQDDTILCPREPAQSVGIIVCTTGRLAVRPRKQTDPGAQTVVERISTLRGASSTSMFLGDFVGVPWDEDTETVLNAPVILGSVRALTDLSNPHLVVAQNTVDAFIVSYDLLHFLVSGGSVDDVFSGAWRDHRFLDHPAPNQPHAAVVRRRCSLPDPSIVLVPRLLVVRTLFRMSMLYAAQSWFFASLPEEDVLSLVGRLECVCFPPGEVLLERGKPAKGIFFFRRGTAIVLSAASGAGRDTSPPRHQQGQPHHPPPSSPHPQQQEQWMPVMAGAVFGERSCVFEDRCRDTVIAHSFCDCWVLAKAEVDRLRSFDSLKALMNLNGVEVATQLLQNVRNEEIRLGLLKTHVPLLDPDILAKHDELHVYTDPNVRHEAHLNEQIVAALRTVPYLIDAPDEMLRILASHAQPKVYMPHCALSSSSWWCEQLHIITKGTATVQLGLRSPAPLPMYPWVYHAGSCAGMECVLEHRNFVATCSTSTVEAWCVSRETLRRCLRQFDLLKSAEALVYRTLFTLKTVLGLTGATLPTWPTPEATATVPGSEGSLPLMQVVVPANYLPSSNSLIGRTQKQAAQQTVTMLLDSALDNDMVQLKGKQFHMPHRFRDVNMGMIGMHEALAVLSNAETHRHERFGTMFPDAKDLIAHRSLKNAERQRLLDAQVARYRELAEQFLLDEPRIPSQRDDSSTNFTEASILHNVTQSFVEVSEKAEEAQLAATARWEASSTYTMVEEEGEEDDDTDNMDTSLTDAPYHRHRRRSSSLIDGRYVVSVTPHVYAMVQVAEFVGETCPWLLQLLGRKCVAWGYLEGSTVEDRSLYGPLRRTNTAAGSALARFQQGYDQSLRLMAHSPRAALFGSSLFETTEPGKSADSAVVMGDAHDMTMSMSGSKLVASVLSVTAALTMRSAGKTPSKSGPPPPAHMNSILSHNQGPPPSPQKPSVVAAKYHPLNPHGYNVILPEAVQPSRPSTADKTTPPLSRGRSIRLTKFVPAEDGGAAPNPKDDPTDPDDILARVIHAGIANEENNRRGSEQHAPVMPAHRRMSYQPRRTSLLAHGTVPQDDPMGGVTETDFLTLEWDMMMRGEGPYSVETGGVMTHRSKSLRRKQSRKSFHRTPGGGGGGGPANGSGGSGGRSDHAEPKTAYDEAQESVNEAVQYRRRHAAATTSSAKYAVQNPSNNAAAASASMSEYDGSVVLASATAPAEQYLETLLSYLPKPPPPPPPPPLIEETPTHPSHHISSSSTSPARAPSLTCRTPLQLGIDVEGPSTVVVSSPRQVCCARSTRSALVVTASPARSSAMTNTPQRAAARHSM